MPASRPKDSRRRCRKLEDVAAKVVRLAHTEVRKDTCAANLERSQAVGERQPRSGTTFSGIMALLKAVKGAFIIRSSGLPHWSVD